MANQYNIALFKVNIEGIDMQFVDWLAVTRVPTYISVDTSKKYRKVFAGDGQGPIDNATKQV